MTKEFNSLEEIEELYNKVTEQGYYYYKMTYLNEIWKMYVDEYNFCYNFYFKAFFDDYNENSLPIAKYGETWSLFKEKLEWPSQKL